MPGACRRGMRRRARRAGQAPVRGFSVREAGASLAGRRPMTHACIIAESVTLSGLDPHGCLGRLALIMTPAVPDALAPAGKADGHAVCQEPPAGPAACPA